jgi:hypothetical protein
MPPGHVASGGGRPVPYRAASSRSSSTNGIGASRNGTLKRSTTAPSAGFETGQSESGGPSIAPLQENDEDDVFMISGRETPSGISSLSHGIGSSTSFSEISELSKEGQEQGNLGLDPLARQPSLKKVNSSGELGEKQTLSVSKGKERAV